MKKVLKGLAIIISILLIIAGVLHLMAPTKYDVNRSITIDTPSLFVHNRVANLKKFHNWDPWSKRDPDLEYVYHGIMGKEGSRAAWDSDHEEVGAGEMKVTYVSPDTIRNHLHFMKPFEDKANGYFYLSDKDGSTEVTWGLKGKNPFPTNILMMFMGMEEMIGKDFEKGLKELKTQCEKAATGEYMGYKVKQKHWDQKTFIGKKDAVAFEDISSHYANFFPAMMELAFKNDLEIAGSPCGLFFKWDEENRSAILAASVPVIGLEDSIEGAERYDVGGDLLHIQYYGPYEESAGAHYAMDDYMADRGLEMVPPIVEEYVTDPGEEPDTAKWLTNIYYPLK